MDKLFEKVRKFCDRHRLIPEGAHVLVGFSGGADSVCLLTFLKKMQEERKLVLTAVHVHHGIRGEEAETDLAFAKAYCEKIEVPFYAERVDVPALAKETGCSLEEAGRKVRYACFERICKEVNADLVAVAHHRDDNAETILYQMLRGTGLKGLSGIRPKNGPLIRPLLGVSREEIEEWLKKEGISWQTDSTNSVADVTRNKIRLELLPYIEREIQPGVKETLLQNAENFAEMEDFLEEQAKLLKEQCAKQSSEGWMIWGESFAKGHKAVQKYVILSCLADLAGTRKDLGQVHVNACLELLGRQNSRRISLPYDLEAIRTYEGILIRKMGNPQGGTCFSFRTERISREEFRHFPENDYTKCFDYDKINNCLILRTRMSGDRICVYQDGRSKKLQDFFVDQKIPSRIRDRIPVLADGDHILWVVGYRVSEAYKVTEQTKRIIKVTIEQPDKSV